MWHTQGTPISLADKNTRDVFGEYIDVYDLTRAVGDGATVPVYYESRLIPLDLPAGVDPDLRRAVRANYPHKAGLAL